MSRETGKIRRCARDDTDDGRAPDPRWRQRRRRVRHPPPTRRYLGCSTSWPTAPAPGCGTASWRTSPARSPRAAWPRCATSFRIWSTAAGAPTRPAVLQATVRAAVAMAVPRSRPDLPLVAGGKSMGGRMTSDAHGPRVRSQGVRGLVFLGFPLHPAKQPGVGRAEHLAARSDADAVPPGHPRRRSRISSSSPACAATLWPRGPRSMSWKARITRSRSLKRSGSTDAQVLDELADTITDWIRRV